MCGSVGEREREREREREYKTNADYNTCDLIEIPINSMLAAAFINQACVLQILRFWFVF